MRTASASAWRSFVVEAEGIVVAYGRVEKDARCSVPRDDDGGEG